MLFEFIFLKKSGIGNLKVIIYNFFTKNCNRTGSTIDKENSIKRI